MCGIAGFANIKNKNFFIKKLDLDNLHNSISHRGPDGFGIWQSDKFEVAFVHRRLAIVDLTSGGHQPMQDDQNKIVISFNGEIYNHEIIKKELENLGYKFKSRSDTETIIYAYKHWGIDCINKLEGMFAFSLFDLEKNELFLVRDRIGVKPLYFSLQDNILSFGSEIKALFSLDFVKKSLNSQSVYHYLTYLITPAPLTIYQDVYKLPAGYYLKLDSQKNISFVNWYEPVILLNSKENYNSFKTNKSDISVENYYIDKLIEILDNSIEKRLMSDVPLGVFLSGGVDSSLLLALMSKHTDNLKSFNISYDVGGDYNEQKYARQIADQFNSQHTELVIGEKESFDFYSRMLYHQDEPLADCVSIPLYYISQSLRDSGARVVLIGEGADELFFGYSMYSKYLRANNILSKFNFFPDNFKKLINYSMQKLAPNRHSLIDLLDNWSKSRSIFYSGAIAFGESFKHDFFKYQNFAANLIPDLVVSQIYPEISQGFDSYNYLSFYEKKFNRTYNLDLKECNIVSKKINSSGLISTTLNSFSKITKSQDSIVNLMLYFELKNRLPELLLMRADKMTMAASIEGREPFLDHNLVDFAFSIPGELKYKNNINKYILKKAAERYLPKDIIYRKKVGFAAPTKFWFKDGKYFKAYFQDLLVTKRKSIEQYFDIEFIEFMLKEHESGRQNFADQLWTLQNLFSLDCF